MKTSDTKSTAWYCRCWHDAQSYDDHDRPDFECWVTADSEGHADDAAEKKYIDKHHQNPGVVSCIAC